MGCLPTINWWLGFFNHPQYHRGMWPPWSISALPGSPKSWAPEVEKSSRMCAMRMANNLYGYGSIPINTIFRGMNIHLPAILMFTRGTRFWHIPICLESDSTTNGPTFVFLPSSHSLRAVQNWTSGFLLQSDRYPSTKHGKYDMDIFMVGDLDILP